MAVNSAQVSSPRVSSPPRKRAAVIVIHGIGNQPPIATLGRFGQGLLNHATMRGARPQVEPVLLEVGGELRSALKFSGAGTPGGVEQLDVFEFAWQGLAHGRISVLQVIGWLLRISLAPLDFRKHWRVLVQAGDDAPAPWLIVLRQVLIAGGLLVALALPPLLTGMAISRVWQRRPAALQLPALDLSATDVLLLGASTLLVLLAVMLLGGSWLDQLEARRIGRRTRAATGRSWRGLYADQAQSWRGPALATALLVLLLAAVCVWFSRSGWAELAGWLYASDTGLTLLLAGLLSVIIWAGSRFLLQYAGGVALYVTSDTSSGFHRTREAIKEAASRLLRGLLLHGEDGAGYDRIVLVGHSLGSVIAYDALNRVSREHRAEGTRRVLPLGKIRGLLTMGSPLDKVAYFFREQVGDEHAIHAQLLSFLHPTKRRSSRRDDGPYTLAPYSVPFGRLRWTHLHAATDPLSDPLVFFDVDRRVTRNYPLWNAHGAYWRDPVAYGELFELLAGVEEAADTAAVKARS